MKSTIPHALLMSATVLFAGKNLARSADSSLPQGITSKPNIVFILADDLGYMDVDAYAARVRGVKRSACYYETPNIDRLVDQGVDFSQAYVYQLCSPSRAAIMTGRNPCRIGVTTAWFDTDTNYYNQGLTPPPGYLPLDSLHSDPIKEQQAWLNGRVLLGLPAGTPLDEGRNEVCIPEVLTNYDSAFIGKWHLGGAGVVGHQPQNQGFKHVLAYYDSGGSRYFGWRRYWVPGNWKGRPGWRAIWNQPRAHGFFPASNKAPYLTTALTDVAVKFIHQQAAHKTGRPFLLDFCEFAVHEPLQAPAREVAYFKRKANRGWNGDSNPVYAAMVKSLDNSVGRVIAALRKTGQVNNTIIVFLSDNGGLMQATSNAPLRDGKAFLYEGGVRVPFVIWWPHHFHHAWCNAVVNAATDVLPTLAALTGSHVPDKIDGESVVPLLKDPANHDDAYKPKPIYWSYPFNCILTDPETGLPLPPSSAIRVGNYKLIWNWAGTLELYDIAHDIGERHNLAAAKPRLAMKLFRQLVGWLDHNVERRYLPSPNPNYQPGKDPRRLLYGFRNLRAGLLGLTNAPGLPNAGDLNSESFEADPATAKP